MSQHMDALRRANEIRSARSEIKRRLRTREVALAELLEGRLAEIDGMAVGDLLIEVPRWGRTKLPRVLARAGIARETRKIGELTERQREALGEMAAAVTGLPVRVAGDVARDDERVVADG